MTGLFKVIGLLTIVLHCNGIRTRKQAIRGNNEAVFRLKSARRFELPHSSVIIGAPSYPNHLPEAEPILPGHTLLRPGLGMLKSAVKFPHRELEGGSGVYGNWDNIGIRYDGKNERVMYSGFRRSNSNDPIVVYLPLESRSHKTKTKKDTENELLSRIIQDMQNTDKRRHSKKRDTSKEIKKSEKKNGSGKDDYLSLMLRTGNKVIDNTLKSWNLKDLIKTKDKYIKKLLRTIQSLRRNKNDGKNLNHQTLYLPKQDEETPEKKSYVQHKDIYQIPETSDRKPEDPIESESSSETDSEEISSTPSVSATVTPDPNPLTEEQRKLALFWETKDEGNHVKFNQNALDFEEFSPKQPEDKDMEQIQGWWFFNQADHTALHDKRRRD